MKHIRDINHGHHRIKHSKVAHSVDCDRHRIFGENFLWGHVESHRSQVSSRERVKTRQCEKHARTLGPSGQDSTQSHDHSSLVFFHYLFFLVVDDLLRGFLRFKHYDKIMKRKVTLTHANNENGNVNRTNKYEHPINKEPQQPKPSSISSPSLASTT